MNILYIMRYWPFYGGGETITATLSNEFAKRGHHVFIAYTHENTCDPMPYVIDSKIVEKKICTIEGYGQNDISNLRKFIIEHHVDIMINQWGNTELCSHAKEGTNCKLITCWHLDVMREVLIEGWNLKSIIKRALNPLFQKYMQKKQISMHDLNYRLSDKYVFLSPSFMNIYKEKSGNIDVSNKLGAISNPLTYETNENSSILATKKNEVLFVGRVFEYHKKITRLLSVWDIINKNKAFDDWVLTIVGDGPDLTDIKEMSLKKGLKNISFEGFKAPLEYYKRASIFAMTSAFEGFGMTLVEAQQNATVPIVMDSYSSLHDIVSNDKNGVIVKNGDIQQYANNLMELMADKLKRESLAIEGLNTCEKFSVSHIADNWEMLFSEVHKKNKTTSL